MSILLCWVSQWPQQLTVHTAAMSCIAQKKRTPTCEQTLQGKPLLKRSAIDLFVPERSEIVLRHDLEKVESHVIVPQYL